MIDGGNCYGENQNKTDPGEVGHAILSRMVRVGLTFQEDLTEVRERERPMFDWRKNSRVRGSRKREGLEMGTPLACAGVRQRTM